MDEPEFPPPSVATEPVIRRLRRSRTDRVIGGVCGGFGHYLGVDPVMLRVTMVVLALSGVGVLAYIVAWVLIPEAADENDEQPASPANQRTVGVAIGAGLIALGLLLLIREWFPWFDAAVFWPLVVVAVGAFILISVRR